MAAISGFPSLHPPVTEDSMEMSSPTGRTMDDDIEIDFDDDYPGISVLPDDERMIDDGEQRPVTATDEQMEEEEEDEAANREETLMQDDVPEEAQDDELIDYTEDDDQHGEQDPEYHSTEHLHEEQPELHGQALSDDSTPVHDIVYPSASVIHAGPGTEEVVQEEVRGEALEESPELQHGLQANVSLSEVPAVGHSTLSPRTAGNADGVADESLHLAQLDAEVDEAELVEEQILDEQESSARQPINVLDQTVSHPALNSFRQSASDFDAPGTPTDTGLHPMTLYYANVTFPLFRSRACPNGLLKDDNLVSVSLAELINNCKQRLVLKTKVDIDNSQEIVLSFDSIELTLVENCQASFETSLSDVLEVFLSLHQNDGYYGQNIPTLKIICTLQSKFSSTLKDLQDAAASGQGLSSLAFSQNHYEDDDIAADTVYAAPAAEDGTAADEGTSDQYDEYAGEGEDYSAADERYVGTEAGAGDPNGDKVDGPHAGEPDDDHNYDPEEAENDEVNEEQPLGFENAQDDTQEYSSGETGHADPADAEENFDAATIDRASAHHGNETINDPALGSELANLNKAEGSQVVDEVGFDDANETSANSSITLLGDGNAEKEADEDSTTAAFNVAAVDTLDAARDDHDAQQYPADEHDTVHVPKSDIESSDDLHGSGLGDLSETSGLQEVYPAEHTESAAAKVASAGAEFPPLPEDLDEEEFPDIDFEGSLEDEDQHETETDELYEGQDDLVADSYADADKPQETPAVAVGDDKTSHSLETEPLTLDFEDDIGFDDDTTEQHEARKASLAQGSPSSMKRARETDDNESDLDTKKVRAS